VLLLLSGITNDSASLRSGHELRTRPLPRGVQTKQVRHEPCPSGDFVAEDLVTRAGALMMARRFRNALPLLRRVIDQDPSHWGAWYMAGQCCRFFSDFDRAIEYLSRAAHIRPSEPAVLSALGIALQLRERWDEAVAALRGAIEIDPDYELAYNSLALIQKKRGNLDGALENYEAGVKALARRIVKGMTNSQASPILKHCETRGTLWLRYAALGALHLACTAQGITTFAWPTGQFAEEEEETEKHAGLYWIDTIEERGTTRLFLPNFFNTFRESLRKDSSYALLIGNRGVVLELLGRHDEAGRHYEEATEFSQAES
jgi:tetratricopeptide (TPR) repeat protein